MKRSPLRRKTPLKSYSSLASGGGLKRSPLSPVSKRRKEQNKEYTKVRKDYMAAHPRCELCNKADATDIHHKAGRWKGRLVDANFFMSLCRDCHEHIHKNPAWAYGNGYLIKR